ncbi:hypothetical protein E5082_30020 [Streptomyces griseoluteus]|uniref:Uncharacterized protein n=1 Tax=Streptomyces griseoluteus TaxID=29306 RepID=A0A4Z1CZ33_STRGP|nr:hypothetical protein [Streptomyces griseoluteus]TGN74351.1 hypothetical protein E5082_30020 [Streptomyces griseoluteus]
MDKDDLENVAWLLGEIFAAWSQRAAEAVAAYRARAYGPPTTADVTRALTGVVLSFKDELLQDSSLAPDARAYTELRLPMVPNGRGRYGRADVVVWVSGGLNFVIEIDSAPNPASVACAFPLWVRFGKGGIEKIDGVMVLDIRDAVHGVLGRVRQSHRKDGLNSAGSERPWPPVPRRRGRVGGGGRQYASSRTPTQ